MSDPTPNVHETELITQLLAGLALIYLKPGQVSQVEKGQIYLSALITSVELFRQATGRPEGWKPSALEWTDLMAEFDRKIDEQQAKIDKLKESQP